MVDSISEVINEVIKEKCNLKVLSSFYGEEILEIADKEYVDIFIIILNNIRFSEVFTIKERIENSVRLITKIKKKYSKPLIAISGWKEDPFLIEKVKTTADFFFTIPFELDAFMKAVEKCMEMIKKCNTTKNNMTNIENKKNINNPIVAAILGLIFNGLGYLYFNWRYALMAVITFIFFNLLMYILGIIRIGFAINPPSGFVYLFGLVYAWEGYKIANSRNILIELGEMTISELNSFTYAGMVASNLLVSLGRFYACSITIWISIELLRNNQIIKGIIGFIIGVPLALWMAGLIFGTVATIIKQFFYKKHKNIF